MEKHIGSNNIKSAQLQLGNLYMDLCVSKRYVDLIYYEMINEFKDAFMANARPAALFGFNALTNHSTIHSQIKSIITKLEEKIMELESYIFKL